MVSLAQCGEPALLSQIRTLCSEVQPRVIIGVGDDAAVIEKIGPVALVSVDMVVENEDFCLDWATGKDIGQKAAAINLSDMAAMGALPRGMVLSIAAAPHLDSKLILDVVRGVRDMGRRFEAPLVGGDLSQIDGPLTISVTVMGEAKRGQILRRYGGKPGDLIAVTGSLGQAAAGLHFLLQGKATPKALKQAQLRPQPQIRAGRILAQWGKVRGCADISDGLVRDALHTAKQGCGVRLQSNLIPISRSVHQAAKAENFSGLSWALKGGEDFQLVFSFSPKHRENLSQLGLEHGLKVTVVGEVVRQSGVWVDGEKLPAANRGFEHFRS